MAGGCFEGGETGREGDVEERDGGEGEECVVRLGEEFREGVPAGAAVEFLGGRLVFLFKLICLVLWDFRWRDIRHMHRLVYRVGKPVIHTLAAPPWGSSLGRGEGIFSRVLLTRRVWLGLVSGRAQCIAGSGA